jgi:hypothetical protein
MDILPNDCWQEISKYAATELFLVNKFFNEIIKPREAAVGTNLYYSVFYKEIKMVDIPIKYLFTNKNYYVLGNVVTSFGVQIYPLMLMCKDHEFVKNFVSRCAFVTTVDFSWRIKIENDVPFINYKIMEKAFNTPRHDYEEAIKKYAIVYKKIKPAGANTLQIAEAAVLRI